MSKKYSWLTLFLAMGILAGLTAVPAYAQTAGGGKPAATQKKTAKLAGHQLGASEAISGKISSVDTTTSTVTVTFNGVPYVFRLTKKTKIQINGNKGDLEALAAHVNQSVSLRFVPRSDGNFAEQVEVKS